MEITCAENTLVYDPDLCVGCGLCSEVCPHGVFSEPEITVESKLKRVRLMHPEDCMECGACALNCLTGAIRVSSGVGCASAMIYAALTGKEISCGGPSCCGPSEIVDSGCCSPSEAPGSVCCASSMSSETQCCGSSPAQTNSGCCGSQPAEDCCTSARTTDKRSRHLHLIRNGANTSRRNRGCC